MPPNSFIPLSLLSCNPKFQTWHTTVSSVSPSANSPPSACIIRFFRRNFCWDTEAGDTAMSVAICALLKCRRISMQSWLSAGVSWGKRKTRRLEAPLYTLSVSFCKEFGLDAQLLHHFVCVYHGRSKRLYLPVEHPDTLALFPQQFQFAGHRVVFILLETGTE